MPEPDLNFIARQLVRIAAEIRDLKDEVRGLRFLREDIGLLREEVRIAAAAVRRLDDTITMNVLDRLQALEAGRDEERDA